MFKKVLVGLDGSKAAEGLLHFVAKVAQGLDLSLVLMSALDSEEVGVFDPLLEVPEPLRQRSAEGTNPEFPSPRATDSERIRELESALESYLQGMAKRLEEDGLNVTWTVSVGNPAEEILNAAERTGCNLIALASYSDSTSARGVLGSVAVKVLHASHIPMVLLNPDAAQAYADDGAWASGILVPLDGSSLGEMALAYAEDLSKHLSLPLTLVRAMGNINAAFVADPAMGMALTEEMAEALDAEAQDYLARVQAKLKGEGVAAEAELLKGAPAKAIVALAQDRPQSMIVMTSHGRSSFARWLLGSVTEAVVRTAANAVFIIPRRSGKHHAIEVTALLEQTPMFANLAAEDLERIAQVARIRSYRAGELIVHEGDISGGFYILTMGKVEVLKGQDLDTAKVLDEMGAGDFFGEMSIIDAYPRSATIRALEPTECVTLRRVDFMRQLEQRPEIAVRMLPDLVKRLREARENPVI